ncbi:MAG: carbohydrate ABC transporter permease [Candidatus Hydrogenedentes bacterium]|nr:carbohydrate ABC transporter permease [Candidatus Hydrogenedentota bacterium]
MASKSILKRLVAHLVLASMSVLFVAPFVWMVSTSLKHESKIFPKSGEPPQWIPRTEVLDDQGRRTVTYQGKPGVELRDEEDKKIILVDGQELSVWPADVEAQVRVEFHWQNYPKAFDTMDFWINLRNTLFICVSVVIGTVISCSLVAYSFSRIDWPGRDALFVVVLATMMLPYEVTLVPLFVLYKHFGWTGSFKPLIVPAFFGTPFYIFLLRQFFMGIPRDLSAAARIDGCSELGTFMHVILPLAKPALATTALFMFLFQWADFLNPLIYLQDDRQYTLAIALQQFQSNHESEWGPLMAMSTVITAPIVVLFFLTQRTFIQGITMTGLKG